MIRMESRTQGIEGFAAGLVRETELDGVQAVKLAAVLFQNEVKLTLTGQRSGRLYRVPGTSGAVHQASAPGEPPAVLFGHLRNSIGHTDPVVKRGQAFVIITAEVGTGLGVGAQAVRNAEEDPRAYARRLELGGVDSRGVRILPRPYIRPAQEKVEPKIGALWRSML